jgi:hypothetical protein
MSVGHGLSKRAVLLIAAVLLVIILGGGAVVLNARLADVHSPAQVVQEQFAAQAAGDIKTMWEDSTFNKGAGAQSSLFSQQALQAMMRNADNRRVSGLAITDVKTDGPGIAHVAIKYLFKGVAQSRTVDLQRDSGQRYYLLYPRWRVVVPAAQITIAVPPQRQLLAVDGMLVNDWSPGRVSVISGVHQVELQATPMLSANSQLVDATSGSAAVAFSAQLSSVARAAAGSAVVTNLQSCDPAKSEACLGHLYQAPRNGNVYYLVVPGAGDTPYTQYVNSLKGDPTAAMMVTVSNDPGSSWSTAHAIRSWSWTTPIPASTACSRIPARSMGGSAGASALSAQRLSRTTADAGGPDHHDDGGAQQVSSQLRLRSLGQTLPSVKRRTGSAICQASVRAGAGLDPSVGTPRPWAGSCW